MTKSNYVSTECRSESHELCTGCWCGCHPENPAERAATKHEVATGGGTATVALDAALSVTSADAQTVTCKFCRTTISAKATICPACGAVHKGTKWTSPRERLRTDIVGGILVAWLFAGLITAVILIVIGQTTKSSTSTKAPYQVCRDAGLPPSMC